MMVRFIAYFILTISVITGLNSCGKLLNYPKISDGNYTGTFQRQVAGKGDISAILMTFSGKNWTGKSDGVYSPFLCAGTFRLNSNHEIFFENTCPRTDNADLIILDNKYNLRMSENSFTLTRDYGSGVKDIYILNKQ